MDILVVNFSFYIRNYYYLLQVALHYMYILTYYIKLHTHIFLSAVLDRPGFCAEQGIEYGLEPVGFISGQQVRGTRPDVPSVDVLLHFVK